MERLSFAPDANGGNSDELAGLYLIHPWIKEIVGDRKVSIIYLSGAKDLPTHSFDESACGYNTTGRVVSMKDGKIVRDVSFDEVHAWRKSIGLEPVYLNSPQTAISGAEHACVILQDHARDHDSCFNGVSLEVFLCEKGTVFNYYPEVRAWLAIPKVRQRLQGVGLPV